MNGQVRTKGRAPARCAEVRNAISISCAAAVAFATVVVSAGTLVAAPPEAALKKRGIEVKAAGPDEKPKNVRPINEVVVDPATPTVKPMKPEDVKGPHPVIKVDEETHDFGTGWVGPPLKHSFKITNGGDAPLEITRVKPACGCTIAGDYPKTLAPGATGDFPFSMASNKLRGHFEKAITIGSNDPVTPELRVKLKGEMKRYVDVTPPSANFAKITSQEAQERIVNITNNTDNVLKLTFDPPADSKFKAEIVEKTPGKQFDLKISAIPPFEPGNLRTTFTLKTNIPEQNEVTVDVNGLVPDRLEIQPTVITLNPARPGAEDTTGLSRVIRFTNYGKDPVKVLEATVDDPTVTVTVAERKAGENYTIQVQMPAGYAPPSTGRTITLKTDDKEKPTITVPIQGSAAPTIEKTADKAAAPKPEAPKPLTAKPAPPFKLTTIDGKEVSNESLKGSVAVLDFFAPNCGYCKKQIPRLETVRAEYAEKPVRFINVSQKMGAKEFTQEEVVTMMKEMGYRGELALNHTNEVGQLFQASGFPTMVILDKEGKVAVSNVGNLGDLEERMKKQLNALIDGKPIPADAMPAAPAAADKPAPPAADAMVGKPAPAINLKTVDGKDLTNATFAQSPATVLDFFAVNCGYCVKQIPRLETVRQKYAEKGIRFIAVQETMRQEFSKEDAQKKLDEVAWKGEWAQDPGNSAGPGFGARGFPTMVIVNKAGNIEAVNVGNLADLETKVPAQLDAILAGKPASSVASATPPPAPANPNAPTADKPAAPAKRPAELLVGTPAPAFSLQTVAGKAVTSSDFGKHPATVLNFVAPNCGFCKKQIPNVDKVRAEYEAKGIRFVNVAQKMGDKVFTTEETVDVFKQAGSNLELARDEGNAIGAQYKAQSYPTMIVVGKDGKIEHVNIGAKPDLETVLKGQLDGLIAKK